MSIDGVLCATTVEDALRHDFYGPLVVPVAHVLRLADPASGDPWDVGPISVADVRREVEQPADPAACDGCSDVFGEPCRACELRRVAQFVRNGIDPDDPSPITVDVGVFDFLPGWPILDGNHRVLAAAVRGDELISVEAAGDWDRAVALLVEGWDLDQVRESCR